MTYEEIKRRLTSCESKLKELQVPNNPAQKAKNYNTAVQKLTILKESLQKQLKEAEKTAFINGKPSEYKDEKELEKFKDNIDVKSIETAAGKKIKEQEGMKFSVDETKAIATKVGKAVAKALHTLGDEVAHMKAKKIEESSFEIYVQYKNDSDDQFSFYITDDTLHLVDFSFDKEIADVGVKPSGEAIVNVDVLANELVKHFKSLGSANEGMSDDEWADAKEKERLDAHPEKDTILKIKSLLAKEKENQLKEAPSGMFYIEVSIRDARRASAIMDDQYGKDFEMNGSNVYYFTDEQLAYDAMMDLGAQGIEIVDTNVDEDMLQEKEVETPEGGIDQGGDLDVGHQDDEPNMLKKDLYDVITYASKLYKALDKYDQHDGEVDFPHWWQKKVTLARDYMSAAQHYLESEEKQPAIDQLALEAKEQGASKEQETEFHKDLDSLVHKTFGKRKDEKIMKEDWGGSDQRAMNQAIHKALGEPTKMPSPFDDKLEFAVQDEVDFHWDEWPEYQTDREGLYANAKRAYLRAYFKDTFDKMVRMFEPADEVVNESIAKTQKAHSLVVAKMKELAKQYKAGDKSVVAQLKDLTAKKKQLEKQLEKDVAGKNRGQQLDTNINEYRGVEDDIKAIIRDKAADSGFDEQEEAMEVMEFIGQEYGIDFEFGAGPSRVQELFGTKVNYDELIGPIVKRLQDLKKYVSKKEPDAMDDLQQVIRAFEIFDEKMSYGAHMELEEDHSGNPNDKYVVRPCKAKDEPWAVWEGEVRVKGFKTKPEAQAFADKKNKEQGLNEEKATCCGKCGRTHVKGTKCKTPYLKGKDHCRTR